MISSNNIPREIRKYRFNRVAILGSVDFHHEQDSPALCGAIGRQLARELPQACILTGANAITQKRLSEAFWKEHLRISSDSENFSTTAAATPLVFHLAPVGYDYCDWKHGACIRGVGQDMDERRTILATSADVCLAVEGGPGTVDEMKKAIAAGTVVIPLARTGGASSGMFGAPSFVRPNYIEEDDWKLLFDEQASIEETASAVVRMIRRALRAKQARHSDQSRKTFEKIATAFLDAKYSVRPSVQGGFEYVEPTLTNCAHLVYQDDREIQHDDGTSAGGGCIYLGPKAACASYEDLVGAGVVAVVNCTNKRVPCYFEGLGTMQYFSVDVDDDEKAAILPYLEEATDFIHRVLNSGGSVLVHCEVGVSRSATVVMAYLIHFRNMSRDHAYVEVKKRRPKVNPNEGFWQQLTMFEERCKTQRATENAVAAHPDHHPASLSVDIVSSDVGVAPAVSVTKLDGDWAKMSCELFEKTRGDPAVLADADCFQKLSSSATSLGELAFVCLDHVWGRGVKDTDLDWLFFVCGVLDHHHHQQQRQEDSRGASVSMTKIVLSVLTDKESNFNEIWDGEVYDGQITRVIDKLGEMEEE